MSNVVNIKLCSCGKPQPVHNIILQTLNMTLINLATSESADLTPNMSSPFNPGAEAVVCVAMSANQGGGLSKGAHLYFCCSFLDCNCGGN